MTAKSRAKKDTATTDCFAQEIPIRVALVNAVTNIIVGVSKLGDVMSSRQFMEAATALNRAWELYKELDGDEQKVVEISWGKEQVNCNTRLN